MAGGPLAAALPPSSSVFTAWSKNLQSESRSGRECSPVARCSERNLDTRESFRSSPRRSRHHLENGIPFEKGQGRVHVGRRISTSTPTRCRPLRKGIPTRVVVRTVGRPFESQTAVHLVAKAFASWSDQSQMSGAQRSRLARPTWSGLGARRRADGVDPATYLPQADSADLAGLESSVGNGFHNMPLAITWEMAADMRRRGVIIGSHTRTHVSLPMESRETVAEELEGSKRELERRLGETIQHFAYPGGQFTGDIVDAVAAPSTSTRTRRAQHDVAGPSP